MSTAEKNMLVDTKLKQLHDDLINDINNLIEDSYGDDMDATKEVELLSDLIENVHKVISDIGADLIFLNYKEEQK